MTILKKLTALAAAAAVAGTVGLNASALVSTYDWKAVKDVYYGAPTSAGSQPDFARFIYSPNGYTTYLKGVVNTKKATGSLTVSCTCSYANMTSFRMTEQGEEVTRKVNVTAPVENGIPLTFTAFTETLGNTFTATGVTYVVQ